MNAICLTCGWVSELKQNTKYVKESLFTDGKAIWDTLYSYSIATQVYNDSLKLSLVQSNVVKVIIQLDERFDFLKFFPRLFEHHSAIHNQNTIRKRIIIGQYKLSLNTL